MPHKKHIGGSTSRVTPYTKELIFHAFSGGTWLASGPAVSAVLAFILSVAFANLLSEEVYGTYRYVLAIAGILTITTLSGLNTAVTRAVAQGRTGIRTALGRRVAWGMLGGISALGIALYYKHMGNAELSMLFMLIAPFIPFMDSFTLYQAVLLGERKFRLLALTSIISQIGATLVILAVTIFTRNLLLILLAYFGSWTLARLIVLLYVRNNERKESYAESSDLKYGYHLSFMSALDSIATQADKMLLFHLLGPASLAAYVIALAVPDQAKTLLKSALSVNFASFSTSSAAEVRSRIRTVTFYLFIFLFFCIAVYVALAPLMFKLLFPKYISFLRYSQVYALVLLLLPKTLHRTLLESHGRTKELYGFQIVSFAVKLALFFVLIPLFGIWGAIAALLLNETIVYLYLEWSIRSV